MNSSKSTSEAREIDIFCIYLSLVFFVYLAANLIFSLKWYERALNLEQWKIYPENCRPMKVSLLVNKFTRIVVACHFSASPFKLKKDIQICIITK